MTAGKSTFPIFTFTIGAVSYTHLDVYKRQIFILATTEVQKIPQTILSRCQRFDFRRVSMRDLEIYFRTILHAEGAVCDDASLEYVCAAADGSIRDGLSILDKLLSSCGKEIHYEDVCQRLGVASEDTLAAMADAILRQNAGSALDTIHGVFESGANLELFVTNMIAYFRDIAVVQSCSNYADILEYSTRKDVYKRQHQELMRKAGNLQG